MTDNYLKVRRPPRASVEFFFDSRNAISVASALEAAREFAQTLTDLGQAESDALSAATKGVPEVVSATEVVVWTHGVRGLGDLHCVGGCELCSPRSDVAELVNADEDEGTGPISPLRVALP